MKFNNQSGQAFMFVVLILSLVLIYTTLIFNGSVTFLKSTTLTSEEVQSTELAEAAIDKAVASLNTAGGAYTGEGNGASGVALGQGEYSISLTNKDLSTVIVQATGYIPNKQKPKAKKTVSIQVSKGIGGSFPYGLQVGDGGLVMGQQVTVNGSVYSNGNIVINDSQSKITGDAYVAGGIQPTADQQSDCSSSCADYIFGRNVAGENRQDVGQSFQPSASNILNKVSLKLKKVGTPNGNPTVRLMGDQGGKPNKNNVITSGTLNASLVGASYGFVDVTFSSTPSLTANTPYWIMIHSNSLDNNNYWVWSEDALQGYTRGAASWSTDWQASSSVWTAINGDLGFKTFMGGVITSIAGSNSTVSGNAYAHLIQNLTVSKDAYYQTITSSIVSGSSCPNSHCHPGSTDPVSQPMPISDSNIQSWKDEATAKAVFTGNITTCKDLPAGKYLGSVTFPNGCTSKVGAPVWITGNLTLGNNSSGQVHFNLDPAFGPSSGVVISDGFINIGDQTYVQGSGTTGSYIIILSTFNTRDDPQSRDAIVTTTNLFNGVLYSNLGSIRVVNNGSLYQLVGWKVYLNDQVNVNYQTGLSNVFFSSGPAGSYSVIKGTYQSK